LAWTTFTSADLLAAFSADERDAYQRGAGVDNLDAICANTVEEIRQAIRRGDYALDVAGTIPAGQKASAIAIARYRFLNGLPLGTLLTQTRVDEYKAAQDDLAKIAIQKAAVELPAGTTAAFSAAGNSGTIPKVLMRTDPSSSSSSSSSS